MSKRSDRDKYTDPELGEQIKEEIRKSDRGGKKGQWSARKSQLLTQEYEKRDWGDGRIFLTFDDGPDPIWTPLVLDALRAMTIAFVAVSVLVLLGSVGAQPTSASAAHHTTSPRELRDSPRVWRSRAPTF